MYDLLTLRSIEKRVSEGKQVFYAGGKVLLSGHKSTKNQKKVKTDGLQKTIKN